MKKLNNLLLVGSGAFALAVAAPAVAEHHEGGGDKFTFESTTEAPASVGGVSPTGAPYGGSYTTGVSSAQYANGTKTTSKFTCISMTQPPTDAIFKVHMICDVDEGGNTFTAIMGCQYLNKDGDMSCVGGLQGKTGTYKGRSGSITNHSASGKGSGTGHWFK